MKKFRLPKKRKFKSIVKFFIGINISILILFAGIYFYFKDSLFEVLSQESDPQEVLGALISQLKNKGPINTQPVTTPIENPSPAPSSNNMVLTPINIYDFKPQTGNDRSTIQRVTINNSEYFQGGVDNGPILPSSCSTTSSSFNLTGNCALPSYEYAPILELWGNSPSQIPVLFYASGMYQVKSTSVKLISRFVSSNLTSGVGTYDAYNFCGRNWFPRSVVRDLSSRFYFGHNSLSYGAGNCYGMNGSTLNNPVFDNRQFYEKYEFARQPRVFQYQVSLKNTGGNLVVDKVLSKVGRSHLYLTDSYNFSNPNHFTYCYGKNADGACNFVGVYQQYNNDYKNEKSGLSWSAVLESENGVLRSKSFCDRPGDMTCTFRNLLTQYYESPIQNLCFDRWSTPLGLKRSFWFKNTSCPASFAGMESPETFYLSNKRREPFSYPQRTDTGSFTHNQPSVNSSFNFNKFSGYTQFKGVVEVSEWWPFRIWAVTDNILRIDPGSCESQGGEPQASCNGESYTSKMPGQFLTNNTANRSDDYHTNFYFNDMDSNTIADYASDAYFFKVTYSGSVLRVYRFGQAQVYPSFNNEEIFNTSNPEANRKYLGYAELSGVTNLPTRNVSFNVSSDGDLDILFAPEITEVTSNSSSPNYVSKMYRVPKFNHVNPNDGGVNGSKGTGIYLLNGNSCGYTIPVGVDTPLTFKYVNVADSSKVNDYAVFASKFKVYRSNIPYCSCGINDVSAFIQGTSIKSPLNGVFVSPGSNRYRLSFATTGTVVSTCGMNFSRIELLRENLYFQGSSLGRYSTFSIPFSSLIDDNRMQFEIIDTSLLSGNRTKWKIQLFAVDELGQRYPIKFRGMAGGASWTSGDISYIEEGGAGIRVLKKSSSGSDYVDFNNPDISVTQAITSLGFSNSFSRRFSSNKIDLSSTGIGSDTFYWNHDLIRATASSPLTDRVSTKICFNPANDFQNVNLKIDDVVIDSAFSGFYQYTILDPAPRRCFNISSKIPATSSFIKASLSQTPITVKLSGVDRDLVIVSAETASVNGNLLSNSTNTGIALENLTSSTTREGIAIADTNTCQSLQKTSANTTCKTFDKSTLDQHTSDLYQGVSIGMSSSSSASPTSRPLATSNIFTLSSQVAKNFNCDGGEVYDSSKLIYVYQKPSGTTSPPNLECDLKKLGLLDKPEAKIIILNEANIKMTLSDSLPADLPKIRNTFIYKNYKPEGTAVGPAVTYTVNCGTNVALGATSPNAYLCFPGNRFQSSGGVFGSLKFSGQVQPEVGASNPIKLTITQSPDVLPAIQKFLYKNKASIISERKVILKYK